MKCSCEEWLHSAILNKASEIFILDVVGINTEACRQGYGYVSNMCSERADKQFKDYCLMLPSMQDSLQNDIQLKIAQDGNAIISKIGIEDPTKTLSGIWYPTKKEDDRLIVLMPMTDSSIRYIRIKDAAKSLNTIYTPDYTRQDSRIYLLKFKDLQVEYGAEVPDTKDTNIHVNLNFAIEIFSENVPPKVHVFDNEDYNIIGIEVPEGCMLDSKELETILMGTIVDVLHNLRLLSCSKGDSLESSSAVAYFAEAIPSAASPKRRGKKFTEANYNEIYPL